MGKGLRAVPPMGSQLNASLGLIRRGTCREDRNHHYHSHLCPHRFGTYHRQAPHVSLRRVALTLFGSAS